MLYYCEETIGGKFLTNDMLRMKMELHRKLGEWSKVQKTWNRLYEAIKKTDVLFVAVCFVSAV